MSGNPDKRQRKFGRGDGCLFAVASWFGSAILLFTGIRQAVPQLFAPEDWSNFWFWGIPSIVLFIAGIFFLYKGFSQ